MAVDMREYDDLVSQALDMSATHREHERTENELRDLLKRLKVDIDEPALKALGRYVSLSQSRRVDSDFNTYGPGAVSGM